MGSVVSGAITRPLHYDNSSPARLMLTRKIGWHMKVRPGRSCQSHQNVYSEWCKANTGLGALPRAEEHDIGHYETL